MILNQNTVLPCRKLLTDLPSAQISSSSSLRKTKSGLASSLLSLFTASLGREPILRAPFKLPVSGASGLEGILLVSSTDSVTSNLIAWLLRAAAVSLGSVFCFLGAEELPASLESRLLKITE